jgi:hypothetical protein
MNPLQAYSMALIMHQTDVPIHIQASLPVTPMSSMHSFGPKLLHLCKNIFLASSSCNPLFHKSLKYSKTEASISGFFPCLGPEKDFLFVRHENSVLFLYFTNDVYIPHILYTFYHLHD